MNEDKQPPASHPKQALAIVEAAKAAYEAHAGIARADGLVVPEWSNASSLVVVEYLEVATAATRAMLAMTEAAEPTP